MALALSGEHSLTAVFDAAQRFSELWITASESALIIANLTLRVGAPPVHLTGVRLSVHSIRLEGGTLEVSNCTLTSAEPVARSRRLFDGLPPQPSDSDSDVAAMVDVRGAAAFTAHNTIFEDAGAALAITDSAVVQISACTLRRLNNSVIVRLTIGRGGHVRFSSTAIVDDSSTALRVDEGTVVLANHTVLLRNARALVVGWGASITYELPAPLGRWVFDPNNDGISDQLQSIDSDYPYACSAGLLGETYDTQSTPGCTRTCPAGQWCGMASSAPTPCEVTPRRIEHMVSRPSWRLGCADAPVFLTPP